MKKSYWAIAYKIMYGVYPISGGGGKQEPTVIQAPAQPPAPSATESAENIYAARVKYDPQLAQLAFEQQQRFLPQQTALETALLEQYSPRVSQNLFDIQASQLRQGQALQRELQPQATAITEAGAGRALELLQNPFAYSSAEQSALDAIRQRTREQVVRNLREQANVGGNLYSGRSQALEARTMSELENAFAQEDMQRRLQAGQIAQQGAIPYLSIINPQVAQAQANLRPFQYESAVPSADTLYNALYGSSRRDNFFQQGSPSPAWGLAGSIAGGLAQGAGTVMMLSSIRYKKNIRKWARLLN